jgi:SpoVK/Ycf46/Vps4 family AAA+-type ATPase
MEFSVARDLIHAVSGSSIPEVELLPELLEHERLLASVCEYFFKSSLVMPSFPFKGFILEGPPGTGKTEIVKQVARQLDKRLRSVFLLEVDGATIAAPRWGEAENRLREVFAKQRTLEQENSKARLIVLFDDIESLMLSRGADLAKEWHYSINSILFHEVDRLNPTKTLVCATTNRIDLVDDAIRTRLYPIGVNAVSIGSLIRSVREILDLSVTNEQDKAFIEGIVVERLKGLKNPTIRDARQITVVECVKNGVWTP